MIKLKKVVSLGKFDVLMELAVATQPTAEKYDTKGRFVYFKNGIGAIYQKTSQEWIEAFAKKAKASKPYENAIRRGRGAFPQ